MRPARVRGVIIAPTAGEPPAPLPGEAARRKRRPGDDSWQEYRPAAGDDFLTQLLALLRPSAQALLRQVRWPQPLYEFQLRGVVFLYERSAALLADDMGLGKTVQALAAIHLLLAGRQIGEALVICPASLVTQWSEQVRAWLPQLAEAHTVLRGSPEERHAQWRAATPLKVIGYETLRADLEAGRLPRRKFGLVVLDEAQRIKNAESALAVCCKALPRERSWALSGTPLENRLEDLASILEFITGERGVQLAAGPALRARQRQLQLRRRKEDVFDQLPAKTVIDVAIDLTPEQRAVYDELEQEGKKELEGLGEEARVAHVLALITRLKQVCNFCPRTGASSKLEFLRERLREVAERDRRALVFSQYTDAAVGIRRLRAELGAQVGLFHGGMTAGERELAIRAFKRGETPVLALSLKAGGVGLNLQEASYVFHFDRWWNPAVERQAEDRAHRHGQPLPVTVYRLLSPRTIEERACALLREKEALFARIVDGAPAPETSAVTVAELFGLLELEVPERLRSEG
jgi:SNF2 family DNA or RNA helicase